MGCMSTQLQRAGPDSTTAWPLTAGLDAKLGELRGKGFEVAWIEASRKDLTRLVMEGGEAAIRLDPDPAVDRAWYGDAEIRHSSTREGTWIFVKGRGTADAVSAHQVGPADAA
jgi:mannose-6-phosphate isomerase-like protein (cupin superfamily)